MPRKLRKPRKPRTSSAFVRRRRRALRYAKYAFELVSRAGYNVGGKKLRDYQHTGVLDILDWAIKDLSGRLLFVVPPGGGKTLVSAVLLRLLVTSGLRVLVIAHRREIIGQHYDHLLGCGLKPEMLGIIMGNDKRANPKAPIQIASIDTLSRRRSEWPIADVVVTDEAHRDASDSRRKLRNHYAKAFRLGITATPHRLDGRGLSADFDEMIEGSTMSALIADGYLSAPKTFTVPEALLPDMRRVSIQRGDYETNALSRAVCKKSLIGGIVAHWLRLAEGRATVVFAASVKHSKRIASAFRKAGVAAAHLDGDMSDAKRDEILGMLDRGELSVVSCVNVLAEGWDCSRCKCVIQARPTMSLNLHIQQIGRCMRPWESIVPLVLDHAGNTMFHGLAQMDQSWWLEVPTRKDARAPTVKTCKTCCAIATISMTSCPECMAPFPVRERVPEETTGILQEYVPTKEDMKTDLEHIRRFAKERELSEEWVQRVFAAKYGHDGKVAA